MQYHIFQIFTCFYLTNFFGKEKFSWLPSWNKLSDVDFHFQRHTNFLVKLQCSVFSSAALFLEGSRLIFFSPKIFIKCRKAGQNNKYDITKVAWRLLMMIYDVLNQKDDKIQLLGRTCKDIKQQDIQNTRFADTNV